RRRHTRWPRDWSSDVCSSDLSVRVCATPVLRSARLIARVFEETKLGEPAERRGDRLLRGVGSGSEGVRELLGDFRDGGPSIAPRSEERRVGKGCRCGWWAVQR